MPQNNIKIKEKSYSNKQLIPDIIKMLEEGHTVTLKLRGISMRPFLEDNRDKALLTKINCPKAGDVVLAEIEPQVYVLHRIIKINNKKVTLRGDGNLHKEYCEIKDLKGFVIGFYRKGQDKIDKTNGWKWLIYSFFWTRTFPIRRYLLAIYRRTIIKQV